jgi:hypothetical protein
MTSLASLRNSVPEDTSCGIQSKKASRQREAFFGFGDRKFSHELGKSLKHRTGMDSRTCEVWQCRNQASGPAWSGGAKSATR